jgi:hypothetical protein
MNRATVAVLAALFLPGCASYHYNSHLPGVVHAAQPGDYDVIGQFKVHARRRWALFGGIKLREEDMDKLVADAVKAQGGEGAANLRMVEVQSPGEQCLSFGMAFWCLAGRADHLTVMGDVIRFRRAGEGQVVPTQAAPTGIPPPPGVPAPPPKH